VTALAGSLAFGVGDFWLSAPDPACQCGLRTDLWIDSAGLRMGHLEDEAMGPAPGHCLRAICAVEPGAVLFRERVRSASLATLHRTGPRRSYYRLGGHGTLSSLPSRTTNLTRVVYTRCQFQAKKQHGPPDDP